MKELLREIRIDVGIVLACVLTLFLRAWLSSLGLAWPEQHPEALIALGALGIAVHFRWRAHQNRIEDKKLTKELADQRQEFELGQSRIASLEKIKKTIGRHKTALLKFRAWIEASPTHDMPVELEDLPNLVSLCRHSLDAYKSVRRHFPERVQTDLDGRSRGMKEGMDEIGRNQALKELATALSEFLDAIENQIDTQLEG